MTDKKVVEKQQSKELHPALTQHDYSNLGQIKKLYAPEANDVEFFAWVRRCYNLGVRIYQNESWCVVHSPGDPKERKAVYIDAFVLWNRLLRNTAGFKGIKFQAVYKNDKFKMTNESDFPVHSWDETEDRGELLGAYTVIEMEGQVPFYQYCKFKEFAKTGAKGFMWQRMPEHMIKKVSKMNAARNVCSELGNSYDKDEIDFKNGVVIDAEISQSQPYPEGPPPEPEPESEAKPKPKPKEQKKNDKKEKKPPTDDDKIDLMDDIVNKLGQKTDEFLFTVKIKSTDEIKTWTQIDGIRAALKEFIDKRV